MKIHALGPHLARRIYTPGGLSLRIEMSTHKRNKAPAVASFFSGCGGFDLGFKKAGFRIVIANDIWDKAVQSFRLNHPEVEILPGDIRKITERDLRKAMRKQGVKKIDVVIGGPPCQCFTRLNNNNLRKDDERNSLFREYMRMIKILSPDFVVMENVADLLVRENEKGHNFRDLILKNFRRNGYRTAFKVIKTEYYGVPQIRRRVIFLATKRKNVALSFPEPSRKRSVVRTHLSKLRGKKRLRDHNMAENSPLSLERIKHVPQGGYYEHLPERLKVKKIRNGKLVTVKRYGSYYRRLHPNQPAVTITKNYLIHPFKDRYLSNREHAVLHTFPVSYHFFGTRFDVGQQIANAVPPHLSQRIAEHILEIM